MTLTGTALPCPCNSGFDFSACCGSADRAATPQFTISAPDDAVTPAPTPPLESAVRNVANAPDLFPARIAFQQNEVLWIKMSPDWYHASVFLDAARIKGACRVTSALDFLRRTGARTPWHRTGFIFHTAFCGSTLMSQLLATAYRSLPLREPDALGNLMYLVKSKTTPESEKSAWMNTVFHILSRRYDENTPVVIKANDYANALISPLLSWRREIRVLFMYTPLAEFVTGCLKAENRKTWVQDRVRIVRAIGGETLSIPDSLVIGEEDYAEMAAVYWSYNIAAYLESLRGRESQLRSLEFSDMLADPESTVLAAARLFELPPSPDISLKSAIESHLKVYSKNSDFSYSPQQRKNEIARLCTKFAPEIERAEKCARTLLGSIYPDGRLPGALHAD